MLNNCSESNRNRNRKHCSSNFLLQKWMTKVVLFLIGCFSLMNCAYGEMELLGTRISRYAVNSTIDTRILSTIVTVDFVNSDNCSRVVEFSMQLPLNARVSKMNMNSSTGCTLDGEVKDEGEAQEDFAEQASQGQSAALLQAYDSANYGVDVSIPPLGVTRLEIAFEELLRRSNHQISFHVPVSPGVPVDQLVVDIVVNDPHSGVSKLVIVNETSKEEPLIGPPVFFDVVKPLDSTFAAMNDDILELNEIDKKVVDDFEFIFDIFVGENEAAEKYATAHYEVTDVSKEISDRLPALVKAFYDTGPIPSEGILIPDTSRKCFTHLFNPGNMLGSSKPLPRNFVFVIDVSGSMSQESKLDYAKAAFRKIIQKLNDGADRVAIHAFSNNGMESTWGPEKVDPQTKVDAMEYVDSLSARGGTNLNDAFIDGIKRAKEMQDESNNDSTDPFVPVVIVLTDGQASTGTTNPVVISRNILAENEMDSAKIYAISFGRGADYNLLSGLSIQNNGIVVKIYEGYGDADTQIEEFYQNELGTILMTDLTVDFTGSIETQLQTRNKFPVFPDGSEITVRALTSSLLSSTDSIATDTINSNSDSYIQAVVTGNSRLGLNSWMSEWNYTSATKPFKRQDCVKSFAHSKIEELIAFRDAAISLGSEMKDYAPASFYDNSSVIGDVSNSRSAVDEDTETAQFLIRTAESKALALALEAGIVWPGLTAMVTVENESCAAEKSNVTVCVDEGSEVEEDSFFLYDDDYGTAVIPPPYMSTTSYSNNQPQKSKMAFSSSVSASLPSPPGGPGSSGGFISYNNAASGFSNAVASAPIALINSSMPITVMTDSPTTDSVLDTPVPMATVTSDGTSIEDFGNTEEIGELGNKREEQQIENEADSSSISLWKEDMNIYFLCSMVVSSIIIGGVMFGN